MKSERYVFSPFRVDTRVGSLQRDAEEVMLRAKTFAVLCYLLERAGQLVSKDELLEHVWAGTFVNEGVLTVCITELRKALGDDPKNPRFIATLPKRGYRFIAPVAAEAAPVSSSQFPVSSPDTRPPSFPQRETRNEKPETLLVGREHELSVLHTTLENAIAGHGQLVLLAGEAGIGKTRLTEELVTEAQGRQVRSLVGRCYEDDGAPPFWPWVQITRAYVGAEDAATVRLAMGAGAAVITQVIPDVGEQLGEVLLPQAVDAEYARFRFFDSYTLFLKNVAKSQPLVIILDDLHWADTSSLLLLQFLVRELRDSRILLIGTYRDLEFAPAHPFAHALGELARPAWSQTLVLRGFSEGDVAQFMASTSFHSPSPTLVTTIHEKTGGNPFFVTELVRSLAQERESMSFGNDRVDSFRLPQQVRATIEQRTRTLSIPCRDMLLNAAAIGQEFSLPLLAAVYAELEPSCDRDTLLALLDEAVVARFLATPARGIGQYRFVHALTREALYVRLGEDRRAQLHRHIGEALERIAGKGDEKEGDCTSGKTLTELASHFFLAVPCGEPVKAIRYAIRAGAQADALFAYAEAATHYTRALQLMEFTKSEESERGELLLRLGDVQRKAGNAAAARETFRSVANLAHLLQKQGNTARAASFLARAALGFATGFSGVAAVGGVADATVIDLLKEALAMLGEEDSPLRARVLSRLAVELYWSNETARRVSLSQEAVASAYRLHDPATLAYTLNARHVVLRTPGNVQERLAIATEMMELATKVEDKELILRGQLWRLTDLLELGDLRTADREMPLFAQRAEELQQPSYLWFLAVWNSTRMWLHGNFAEATRFAHNALEIGRRSRDPDAEQCFVAQILGQAAGVALMGDIELPIHNLADSYTALPVWRSALALVYSDLGAKEEAHREYNPLAADDFAKLSKDEYWMVTMSNLAQVSMVLEDRPRIAAAYELLLPYAERCIVVKPALMCLGFVTRLLGRLAAALERWDEAEHQFIAAVQRHTQMQSKPLVTLTQEQYAAMLLGRNRPGDRKRAKLFIEEAFTSAQTLGMNVAAKRIQTLKDRVLRLV